MSKRKEEIFRAGALLVALAQKVFYVLLAFAVLLALGASYAAPAWRTPMIAICWFLVGAAVMGLVLYVLARVVSEQDIADLASSTSLPGN